MQDIRAAIRFLIEYNHIYRIDTSRIFLVGNSAGAIASLLTAFISNESERPASSYGVGTGSDSHDLGCLDCTGNSYSHAFNVAGMIPLWGGIWNMDIIEANDQVPALFIYGTEDNTVPYDTGHAFQVALSPFVYGSIPISRRMSELGIPNEIHAFEGQGHSFYMDSDGGGFFDNLNQHWNPVFTLGHQFLYKIITGIPITTQHIKTDNLLGIFPNPVLDVLNIRIPTIHKTMIIEIFSLQGKIEIHEKRLLPGLNQIDLASLSPGIYILRIESEYIANTLKICKL